MKLSVRTAKVDAVKLQLLSSLELGPKDVIAKSKIYSGITLLNLDESAVFTLSKMRNIEAILLDEASASELLQPTTASKAPIFKSLDGVDELEQYEHLSQLLHMQSTVRDKR